MSLQKLRANNKIPPSGYTYGSAEIYKLKPGSYKEYTKAASSQTVQASSASNTVTFRFQATDSLCLANMYLQFDIENTSATEQLQIFNPFLLLNHIKLIVNDREVHHYRDTIEIREAVSEYLKRHSNPRDNIYNELSKIRPNSSENFNSDNVNVSTGVNYFQLPLLVLFEYLEGFNNVTSGIETIQIDFAFNASGGAAVLNNKFCKSSTTSNAYDAATIKYTNIALRMCFYEHADPLANQTYPSTYMVVPKYTVKKYVSKSWASSADTLSVSLFTEFVNLRFCNAITVLFWDNVANAAYNSSSACKFLSGAQFASVKISKGTTVLLDHSALTTKVLKQRSIYEQQVYYNRYGAPLPLEILNGTSSLSEYFITRQTIDLCNSINDDESPSTVSISGIHMGVSNDIQLDLTCATAISANVDIYLIAHSNEFYQVNPKTHFVDEIVNVVL